MISPHTQTPHLPYTYDRWGHTGTGQTVYLYICEGFLRYHMRMIFIGRAKCLERAAGHPCMKCIRNHQLQVQLLRRVGVAEIAPIGHNLTLTR